MAPPRNFLSVGFLALSLSLTACSTSNSLNPPTGNPAGAIAGGVLGAGGAALLGAPKPLIAFAGVGGASLGYYLTTMRFTSRGIVAAGGQVYTLGDYVIIDIPTDNLFDANTADFLEGTDPILKGIYNVLSRYPHHNIIISGNTSGFWTSRFEQSMSTCRAEQVAAYLWTHGIGTPIGSIVYGHNNPKRIFVGYGDKFPIANHIHIKGIRQNSRIQIVAYPDDSTLYWNECKKHFIPFKGHVQNLDEIGREMEADRTQYTSPSDEEPIVSADSNIKYNGEVDGNVPEVEDNTLTPDEVNNEFFKRD